MENETSEKSEATYMTMVRLEADPPPWVAEISRTGWEGSKWREESSQTRFPSLHWERKGYQD